MAVRIVTDSTDGLSAEIAQKFNITVIPYYVISERESLTEDASFDRIQYYRNLSQAEKLPTTSHPSLQDIVETYQRLLLQSDEPIIHLTISAKLTTTYEMALQAKKELPEARIEVYDTEAATARQAPTAIEAARLANSGTKVEEILSSLKENKERIDGIMVFNTLKYLAKGGRIQRTQWL